MTCESSKKKTRSSFTVAQILQFFREFEYSIAANMGIPLKIDEKGPLDAATWSCDEVDAGALMPLKERLSRDYEALSKS